MPITSGLLLGAIAGVAATATMNRLHKRLPADEHYPLPPREITERPLPQLFDEDVVFEQRAATRLVSRDGRAVIASAAFSSSSRFTVGTLARDIGMPNDMMTTDAAGATGSAAAGSVREIPPRSGVAFRLAKGETLCVIDPLGGQVSDFLAFVADDVREVVSNGRTFDYEETIRLTTGNRLWSNRSNPMIEIVEDSVGLHDFLLTPCSEATFRHFYADKPVHRGCFRNLAEALAPFGIEADAIPVAFNLFMNVPVDAQGKLKVIPPTTRPGDHIRLRALADLVIGLTACSAYDSCGGSFKPIHYRIEPAAN